MTSKKDPKSTPAKQTTKSKPEEVTLEQALKDEGKGRTPETVSKSPVKSDGPTKVDQAMKIMEEVWPDIQSGKVKRKDVIQRFIDEVGLTKAGASTYYGNLAKKLKEPA